MKKPPVTSGYREQALICAWSNEERLKRSVPPELDFVSSQTILLCWLLLKLSEIAETPHFYTVRVLPYILKRRLKPIFMNYLFLPQSALLLKWISSAAWPPASRFIIHSESYRTLNHCTPCRVEDVFTWATHLDDTCFRSSNLVIHVYTLILCLYLIGDTKMFA